MQEIDEEWRPTNNKARRTDTIIEVSNMGRIKRANGNPPEESTLRQPITVNGKRMRIYQFIAEHFIPKTDEDIALKRDCIDHWTHKPKGININDVRNLHWVTPKENSNMDEARENMSKAMKGKKTHLGVVTSEFGKKYFEHYGYCYGENPGQYKKEYNYYSHYGKCTWE